MKMLSILTAAASILLAISGPSLAASRTQAQRSTDAYSSYARDNSDNAFNYSPLSDQRNPANRVQRRNADNPFGLGRNLPYYTDLPYGNPDSW
jgi:hypothetical protein